MTDQSKLLIEDRGTTRIFTLNRPEVLNAVDNQMRVELIAALRAADADDRVRVVIITGAGRAFCAGADLERFKKIYEANDPEQVEYFTHVHFPQAFADFSKPLIAAVNGPAVGVGFTMPMMCDIRLASTKAMMIAGFVRVGVTPEFGSSFNLPRLVGMGKAMELALTARPVQAEEALSLGLVNELVEPEALMDRAIEMAEAIAQWPAPAVRMAKAVLKMGADSTLQQAMEIEAKVFAEAMGTPEHRQAVEAMMAAISSKAKAH